MKIYKEFKSHLAGRNFDRKKTFCPKIHFKWNDQIQFPPNLKPFLDRIPNTNIGEDKF